MSDNTIVTGWHDVGAIDDFADEGVCAVVADGHAVAVFRDGDDVFALHDLCTHGAARLSDGWVEDGCVECPLHQALFDFRTGAVKTAPATIPVKTYPVKLDEGRVFIGV